MNTRDFVVRVPSTNTLILSINNTLYGFVDAHGVTREELGEHLESVRADVEAYGDQSFYNLLWAGSQEQLRKEIADATDAIIFNY